MVRRALVLLALLLAFAAPASAARFSVTSHGALPAAAVDGAGTTHVVWDAYDAGSAASTTTYCRVPRKATRCAPGSTRTFAPVAGDQEFAGPHVIVKGRAVTVVLSRCCSGTTTPTRVFAATSSDRGRTFGAPAVIGSLGPDLGLAFTGTALLTFGNSDVGIALQYLKLGDTTTKENVVAKGEAASGGVGAGPGGWVAAYAGTDGVVRAARLRGDVTATKPTFSVLGRGSDVRVTAGRNGAYVLYLTPGDRGRYVMRRYADSHFGGTIPVSTGAAPIFGNLFQDRAGRVHATWLGERGITYRRSDREGRTFGRARSLAITTSEYADLAVAANAAGRATVVYARSATAGTVG